VVADHLAPGTEDKAETPGPGGPLTLAVFPSPCPSGNQSKPDLLPDPHPHLPTGRFGTRDRRILRHQQWGMEPRDTDRLSSRMLRGYLTKPLRVPGRHHKRLRGDTRRPSPFWLVPPRSGGQHLGDRVAEEVKLPRNKPPPAVVGGPTPRLPTLGCTGDPLFTMVHGKGQRDEQRALLRHPPYRNSTHRTPTLFHTRTGATKLLHLSAAGRHILLADLTSLVPVSHQGVEEGTHQKYYLAWSRWTMWLQSIKLFDDEYLAAFEPRNRTRLLGAFASAVRAARFSGPAYCQLAAGIVSGSVNHVAASFVEAGFPDPRLSEAGAPSRFLQRQYKSYRNLDKNLK
jgi:hypothetical protein